MVVITPTQTAAINATIRAYSTIVAPFWLRSFAGTCDGALAKNSVNLFIVALLLAPVMFWGVMQPFGLQIENRLRQRYRNHESGRPRTAISILYDFDKRVMEPRASHFLAATKKQIRNQLQANNYPRTKYRSHKKTGGHLIAISVSTTPLVAKKSGTLSEHLLETS